MLKVYFFFLLLLPLCSNAQAGQAGLVTSITSSLPPTPNAAALGKFIEAPVSLYTGLPTISIPFWQLRRGDLAVDVALNYHGGGIKVDEIASWVGIGWSLGGAGMITRSVRGLPDNVAQFRAYDLPRLQRFQQGKMADAERTNFLLDTYRGNYDTEPDIYTLSASGLTCQFFMGTDGQFVTMPRELNLRIQYDAVDTYNHHYTWLITDSKGIQYKFSDAEHAAADQVSFDDISTSGTSGGPSTNVEGDTSWGLNELEDTKGNIIQFTYEQEAITFTNITSEFQAYYFGTNSNCFGKNKHGYSYTTTQGTALRLKTIRNGKEEVRFVALPTERQDLAYGHSLDQIQIYYDENLKRVFRFFTSYLNASSIGTSVINYPSSQNDKRLCLDSIREESGDSRLRLPPYRFTYDNSPLPFRGSASQDYWGYYNGSNNTTRVAYIDANNQPAGADKNPNPVSSICGTLLSIRYPTGGVHEFIYEPNLYPERIRISPKDTAIAAASVFSNSSGVDFAARDTFTITTAMTGGIVRPLDVDLSFVLNGGVFTPQINGFTYGWTIQKLGNSNYINSIRSGPSNFIYSLLPGTYILTAAVSTDIPTVYVTLETVLRTTLIPANPFAFIDKIGPGQRLHQLIKHFGTGPDEVHTYTYLDKSTGHSSGIVGTLPINNIYAKNKNYHYLEQSTSGAYERYVCGCKEFSSHSNYPLINSRSSYIGYSYVGEYINNEGHNGKSTHTFTNYDLFNDIQDTSFPYPPNASQDWKRGVALSAESWASNTDKVSYRLQRTDSLASGVLDHSLARAYGLKLGTEDVFTTGYLIGDREFANSLTVALYPVESDSYQLLTKKTTQLTPTGTWQTATTYAYTPNTYLARRLTSRMSDGSLAIQRLLYPTDMSGVSPILQAQLATNQIAVPIEQSQVRVTGTKATLVSSIAHQYGVLPSLSSRPQLYLQRIYTTNTALADTIQHYQPGNVPAFYEEQAATLSLTSHGDPLTQRAKRYQISSYHWGYEERYPVAACTNATDKEFFHENFEGGGATQAGTAHSGINYTSSPYTVTWQTPNARTYQLSYWYRKAGIWKRMHSLYVGPSLLLTGGDAYDDISIYPIDAQLTTYTHDPLVGITSQTDPTGRTVTYEYDGLGRLIRTRDEQGRILSQQQYHYAGK